MAASYPSSAKAFTPIVDGVDYPQAAQINQAYDEITALEQAMVSTGLAHNLFADATATRDLGTSAVKWRDLYLSRNATIGGTLTVGSSTITGPAVQSTTLTGTQNDFAATASRYLLLRCNNATLLTVTGIAAGQDGDVIDVVSVGAGQVDFSPQSGSSTAANRLINSAPTGATSLAPGSGTARYVYDATTARWRLVHHDQGAWISVTFAAGNFTASSGNWTLGSGDQIAFKYWLKGRTLTVLFDLNNTTVSATPADLNIAVPGGHTSASNAFFFTGGAVNNAGTRETFFAVPASGSIICRRVAGTTWSAATDATNVSATVMFEVQ